MQVKALAIVLVVNQVSSRLSSSLHASNASKDAWSVVMILISVINAVITTSSILQPRNVLLVLQTASFAVVHLFVLSVKVDIWLLLMELANFLQLKTVLPMMQISNALNAISDILYPLLVFALHLSPAITTEIVSLALTITTSAQELV